MERPTDLRHDADWLEGLRAGATDALGLAVETYRPMLSDRLMYGFSTTSGGRRVRLRIHDDDERDDVVQETFARAFRPEARASYTGEFDYGAYLLRICRNLAVDRFRRACARERVIAPAVVDLSNTISDGAGYESLGRSPERVAATTQVRGLIAEFLREIGEQELRLLRLYSEGDVSQRQAADMLGIERHDVRAMTASVRAKLLRFMKRRGVIDSLEPDRLLELVTTATVAVCAGWS